MLMPIIAVGWKQLGPVVGFIFLSLLTGHAQTYEVLHSFAGSTNDGVNPGPILQGGNGTLYGTTCYGGHSNAGIVYELAQSGKETILHYFTERSSCPFSLFAWQEGLYGVAGGGTNGDGVIFKLDSSGNETIVHNFSETDGQFPILYFQNSAGLFFGAT